MKITRKQLRKLINESWAYVDAQVGDTYQEHATGKIGRIIDIWEYPAEDDRSEIVYYTIQFADPETGEVSRKTNVKARHFHSRYV